MVQLVASRPSIANHFLKELRDEVIQKDRRRFRRNLQRLGEIMAVEISKTLPYREERVTTPLGFTHLHTLEQNPVLITILRAGLPYFEGFQNYFDEADCGFIGAYRQEGEAELTIKLDYLATPQLQDRIVILIDPMLATGKSITDALQVLLRKGMPAHVHIVALVAAPEGLKHVDETITVPHTVWAFAQDEKLDAHFYIVPGLGDAGDLSFGEKT
jgi:uracil phosphoribosyltransferase